MEAAECGFINTDAAFIDATHIKASANKNKYVKKLVKVFPGFFQEVNKKFPETEAAVVDAAYKIPQYLLFLGFYLKFTKSL
ncbi:MAG: hypothetical protein PWQ91_1237 [Eubacteriales bacterium]|nr:hypothetical protein [Eubacteriales bacterium]